MFFDLGNYWIFIVLTAIIYLVITRIAQDNIGGKGRLKNLQLELKDVQKKMTEAAKNKKEDELNKTIEQNWKLTYELLSIQTKMMAVIIGMLFLLMNIFPFFEPGTNDDIKLILFDDGLVSHCDAIQDDKIYSNCFVLPEGKNYEAITIGTLLKSSDGEAKNSTAIYVNGGREEDVWLSSTSQTGFIDMILGKTAYTINVTTDKKNYSGRETVKIFASALPEAKKDGKFESTIDMGTKFFIDLPFAIPLINIRRIIGSYGVFLFTVFVMGISYSALMAVYEKTLKKK